METFNKTRPRVGVIGGAFNPIHFGHLLTAEAARVEFDLDQVIFMPWGQSPSKPEESEAGPEERYAMTVIATAPNPYFSVSRLEIDRPGPSYTIDTLKQLHQGLKDVADVYFIAGADAVLEILTWKDPAGLAGFCEFIAATRPGFELDQLQELIEKNPALPKVCGLEIPALAISATDIRERVRRTSPIRYLLPDAVVDYINKTGFYK
ncbi:MAG: nicotinate-nucleotide adenylyltransferase [Actinomycetota bacterium]|nr:nicotinate-nucleotide adenylyltransferase [Actinomycetota bacterium]